jgi:DNA helicase-2/ATP-dependent DNA helicase PcrA
MQHSESTFLMELVSTFFDFIKNETAKNPLIHIKELMELIDEMEVNDVRIALDKSIIAANGVQFITAHSSKGLEFEYVWILGCNEKNWKEKNGGNDRYKLPSTLLMKSKEDAEEENRRLFYVAATRAKKQLIISYPKKQNESKENLPSPFLKEMETVLDDKIKTQTITEEVLMQYQMEAMQTPEIIPPVMIDENYIQEFLKKYVLSVTHLNKYLECPIKFYFENILRVPTARSTYMGYGTAIHGALQRLFTSMLKNPNKEFPDVEFLKKVFEEELIKVKSHFTSTQFDNFLFQGKELVLTPYYENYIDTFEKNVWVEYAIKNVEVDGVPINGKLDKIELHSNHKAHVIDYKTGKFDTAKTKLYPPNEKNELGGDYWRQLVFYKIVVEADRSLNLIVETGEMNFVEPDKNNSFHKHVYQITNEDVRLVKTQMKSVYQSIQNMEFENGCNKEDCTWCAFVQSNYTSTPVFSEED